MALSTINLAVYCGGTIWTFNNESVKIGCKRDQGWSHYQDDYVREADETRNTISFPVTVSKNLFEIFFYGTQIVIFGGSTADSEFNWTIDDGQPTRAKPVSIPDTIFDYSLTILNSTGLEDAAHTLTIENTSGNMTVGTYALVRPGPKTIVSDQYLRVDHTDPSITYEGDWKVSQDIPPRHIGTKEGDSILFGFCGRFLQVIGSFDGEREGNLTLGFSIDGRSPELRSFDSHSQTVHVDEFIPYGIRFWDNSEPECRQHSINVTIQRLTGDQSFSFGSFEYTPAFKLFSDAPSITVTPSPTPTSSSSSASGGGNGLAQGHNQPVGPIVGGAVGGAVLIFGTILLTTFLLRKRRNLAGQNQENGNMSDPFSATPFVSTMSDYPVPLPNGRSGWKPGVSPGFERSRLATEEKLVDSDVPDATGIQEAAAVLPTGAEANEGSPGLSIPDEPRRALASPSEAPENQNEIGNMSRRMLELMQSLELRVESALRPPAYDEVD